MVFTYITVISDSDSIGFEGYKRWNMCLLHALTTWGESLVKITQNEKKWVADRWMDLNFLCNFKLKSSSHRWIYLLFKPIAMTYNKLETFTAYRERNIQTLQELRVLGGRCVYHMNMFHINQKTHIVDTGDLYLVSAKRKKKKYSLIFLIYYFHDLKGEGWGHQVHQLHVYGPLCQ